MIPNDVLTEELLQQAAAELATALNDNLPPPNECQHKFSNEFEETITSEITTGEYERHEIYVEHTMGNITKERIKITIVFDKKGPILEKYEFERDKVYSWIFGLIDDPTGLGVLYLKISDDAGISDVTVYHYETKDDGIRRTYPHKMNKIASTSGYNYKSSEEAYKKLFRQFIDKIVITDRAGNSSEYDDLTF